MHIYYISRMKKIYTHNNYIIIDSGDGSPLFYLAKKSTDFNEYQSSIKLFPSGTSSSTLGFTILISDIPNWFNEAGDTAYTKETMIAFLTSNTSFIDGGGASITTFSNGLQNRIVVTQENKNTTLGGVIDSTKEYFLDGVIDMGTTQITVPPSGIQISGYSFDTSGLVSSEDNYTMFVSESPSIGSGNLLGTDYYVEVSGTNSKVYELYDATGFNAFEFTTVNYVNCTNLGDIYDYRQGFEAGTGRFGGSPKLTLHGLWRGGFRVTSSIVRGISPAMAEPLFKEGMSFQMNSRFVTDMNCDLPPLASLLDFREVNFPNSGTLQLRAMELTRDGVYNADDTNLTPNISASDLPCYWKGNNGLSNTYVGGTMSVISEEETDIASSSTWVTLEGGFLGTGLQHFTASADGKLTHNGNSPREFEVTANLIIESRQNNELSVRFVKWDDSDSAIEPLDYTIQTRQVNSLSGGRDVAFFTILVGAILDVNDYLQLQVRNNSDSRNATLENGSYFRIQER